MPKDKSFKQADLEPVKKLIIQKTKDGNLSDKDIDDILKETKHLYKETPLTHQDIFSLNIYLSTHLKENANKKGNVPLILKILGVLMCVSWLIALPTIINLFSHIKNIVYSSVDVATTTSIIMVWAHIIIIVAAIILSFVTGILMILNKREYAGRCLYATIACIAASLITTVTLEGVSTRFYFSVAYMVFQIIISVYLQPKLHQERKFERKIRDLDNEERAKTKRLGLKVDQSKGYIELDFFNLFWIFIVCSIIGLIAEYVFHILFVWGLDPANWYDRAGLLFGPFSPIYGFGGLFMTLFLNRFRNLRPIPLLALTTIIGGAFEYCVSLFLEIAFGVEAWNYSDMFLSLNGRTCLLFATMFGVMGFVWIKWALPAFMKLIAKINWKLRYPITFAATAFMIINCIMTLQSIDCWSQRQAGHTPITPIEKFYEEKFNDQFMSKRFASMSFQEDKSTRSNIESANKNNN